jgi:hypothetical protein
MNEEQLREQFLSAPFEREDRSWRAAFLNGMKDAVRIAAQISMGLILLSGILSLLFGGQ